MWQICHVTDLHVSDPSGTHEHLRRSFFEEYLNPLADQIRAKADGPVSVLVVTGDFVDKGDWGHRDHVRVVLDHFAARLDIPRSKVALCPGNHDLHREKDRAGSAAEARAGFESLAKEYMNGAAVKVSSRARLCRGASGLWCLMLDATLGSGGKNHPGTLEDGEVDELVGWVREVPKDDLLVVGTHYPVPGQIADDAPFDDDDPEWGSKHIWTRGNVLRGRIAAWRGGSSTVWLCGDVHRTSHFISDAQHFITTGRLGSRTLKADSQLRRQARLLRVLPSGPIEDRVKSVVFQYELPGHLPQAQAGSWSATSPEFTQARRRSVEFAATEAPRDEQATAVCEMKPAVEVIDSDLQDVVLEVVRRERLYRFGRFATSDTDVSLAWVSVGPLLNHEPMLSSVVKKMSVWLGRQIGGAESDQAANALLLGVDCWGAVLASQLSVVSGVPNFCVAARARGEHSVPQEGIDERLLGSIAGRHWVVIVSDVIATGRSLAFVRERIAAKVPIDSVRWLALSIICDRENKRVVECEFIERIGTVCGELRMPVLAKDRLPDEGILPPEISFR